MIAKRRRMRIKMRSEPELDSSHIGVNSSKGSVRLVRRHDSTTFVDQVEEWREQGFEVVGYNVVPNGQEGLLYTALMINPNIKLGVGTTNE
jgi:hypothetical protein